MKFEVLLEISGKKKPKTTHSFYVPHQKGTP
jgi:hypothetical protein